MEQPIIQLRKMPKPSKKWLPCNLLHVQTNRRTSDATQLYQQVALRNTKDQTISIQSKTIFQARKNLGHHTPAGNYKAQTEAITHQKNPSQRPSSEPKQPGQKQECYMNLYSDQQQNIPYHNHSSHQPT